MKGAAWLLALFALLEIGHPWSFEALRYDRDGLLHGQIWRALTAHLVHLGPVHAAMNSLAVLLLVALCRPQWSVWGWCWRSAALAVPISLGLLAAVPALASYVGFSGVAHGLFVLALWPLAVRGDWIARGCLLYLLGKLGWEMMFGAAVIDSAWIGGAVIVEAHSFGALAAVAGLALAAWLDARGASRR